MSKILRGNLVVILISVMLGITSVILSIGNIKVFEYIIDSVPNGTVTVFMIIIYAITLLGGYIINYLSEIPQTKLNNKLYLDFKILALNKLRSIEYLEYKNKGYGETLQIIESGSRAGQQIISNFYIRLLREILPNVFFSFWAIYFIEPRIIIILIVGYFGVFLTTKLILNKLSEIKNQVHDDEEELNFILTRSFMELETFRLNNYLSNQITKFKNISKLLVGSRVKMVLIHESFFTIFAIIMGVFKILVIVLAIFNFKLSVGEIVALTMFVDKAYTPIATFDVLFVQMKLDYVAYTRLEKFINIPDDQRLLKERNKVIGNITDYDVNITNVSYFIKNKKILEDINMNINYGDKLAIIGDSGSGKSTLVKLISGLIEPSKGTIRLGSLKIEEYSLLEYFTKIDYLTQETATFKGTIRENIVFDKEVSDEEIYNILEKVNLCNLVNSLPDGLDTILAEKGTTLSGGERQRLALARLYLSDSSLVILDECTSALDVRNEIEVLNELFEALNYKTIILITHNIKILENVEKIVYIEKGKLKEIASYDSLKGEINKLVKKIKIEYSNASIQKNSDRLP